MNRRQKKIESIVRKWNRLEYFINRKVISPHSRMKRDAQKMLAVTFISKSKRKKYD